MMKFFVAVLLTVCSMSVVVRADWAGCAAAKEPCDVRLLSDQQQGVESDCVIGQRYQTCVANALSAAAAGGTCIGLPLITFRNQQLQESNVYAQQCSGFVIPSSLQQDACKTELSTCGVTIRLALNDRQTQQPVGQICSKVESFQNCMSRDTESCIDGLQVYNMMQQEMQDFQTCVTSLTPECMAVTRGCTEQQMRDDANGVAACVSGTNYFNCVSTSLQTAESTQVCGSLALFIYRNDAYKNSLVYQQNCNGFVTPTYLQVTSCQREIATCGQHFMAAQQAASTSNRTSKCSSLESFKTCMEQQTSSCTVRAEVEEMLVTELAFYQYQSTCVSTLSERCSTIRAPCIAEQIKLQQEFWPECTVGQKYTDCLANRLSSAKSSGTCSYLPLLVYQDSGMKEAAIYQQHCPTYVMPAFLNANAISSCDREIAACGVHFMSMDLAYKNKQTQDMCRHMEHYKSCMSTQTGNCTNRDAIRDEVLKELIYYQYEVTCLDPSATSSSSSSSTTTTTTTTPTPKPTTTTIATTTTTPEPTKTTTPEPTTTTTTTPKPTTTAPETTRATARPTTPEGQRSTTADNRAGGATAAGTNQRTTTDSGATNLSIHFGVLAIVAILSLMLRV